MGIGFGQQVHVPAFRRRPGCDVVALAATTYARARAVADRLSVPKAYGDWRDLVGDPQIDVVSVAVPPAVQVAIAVTALAQGKPVFCEKPLAPTSEQAAEMVQAARRAVLPNVADFEFVAVEQFVRAKAMLDRGAVGRVRHASVTWHVETHAHRKRLASWKTGSAALGGGVVNALATHTFHYVEWLLGPVRRLAPQLFTAPAGKGMAGESVAIVGLELAGDIPVSVSLSTCAFLGSGHRIEIYGDEGTLVLDNPTADYIRGFRLFYGTRASGRLAPIGPTRSMSRRDADERVVAVAHLVDRFIDWVQTGVPAQPTFEQGYRVQCLVDAVQDAHARARWVDIPERSPGTAVAPTQTAPPHGG